MIQLFHCFPKRAHDNKCIFILKKRETTLMGGTTRRQLAQRNKKSGKHSYTDKDVRQHENRKKRQQSRNPKSTKSWKRINSGKESCYRSLADEKANATLPRVTEHTQDPWYRWNTWKWTGGDSTPPYDLVCAKQLQRRGKLGRFNGRNRRE